jgi:NADPH:quinone reductase-like Zn-dependent oxidoreductase
MRAVQLTDWGIENIHTSDAADPVPAAGEVLIATEAATINQADLSMVSGQFASWLPASVTAPYTPGWDLAGQIVGVGEGVDASLIGPRAVGFSNWVEAGHGMQASLVALPHGNIATAASGLPSAQLTTVSLNGLTAWAAVKELALEAGQTLVIAGAAGSVGGFALELAVVRGIRVIAAVSERDRDYVLNLGASEVAAREDGNLGAVVRKLVPDGADALFDTTTSLGATGLGAIKNDGVYVTSTTPPEPERGIRVTKIYGLPDGDALQTLADMATAGRLHTPVAREFNVEQARAAYEEFASGPHRGRIVLTF